MLLPAAHQEHYLKMMPAKLCFVRSIMSCSLNPLKEHALNLQSKFINWYLQSFHSSLNF